MTRHILFFLPVLAAAAFSAYPAAAQQPDSLAVEQLQEAVIGAVRASGNAPFAVANINASQLEEFSSTGRELPVLLARTPGIISWSENGVGTGTSYLRIRGAGGSRINVTLDGVPLNSPEDQTVFWANMNSYSTILGSVQIQRGVGSSSNGDGAFGGTIALASRTPSLIPTAELNASWGTFNTRNLGFRASSGLFWKHLVLEGAWHDTATDGYIDGTAGRSGSFIASLSWLASNYSISYKLVGNYEITGQAWNGVTAGTDDLSIMDGTYGEKTGIRTYADMYAAGIGTYNSLCERLIIDENGYSKQPYSRNDGSHWSRTTDNFWQDHHLLQFAWMPSPLARLSLTAHYTSGYGWYDEFRYNNKVLKYGIPVLSYVDENHETVTVKRSDFVRKKGLVQDTYGLVASGSWTPGKWDITGGASVQQFKGNHYGFLTYAGNEQLLTAISLSSVKADYSDLLTGDYRYYDSDASKLDASTFLKVEYKLSRAWSVFGDLQYRYVHYVTDGYNDKYIDNGDGTASRHYLDVNQRYNFFNPKAGVNFSSGGHRAYASFAMSNREPERNNFTDNGKYPAPRAERLMDYELGYQYGGRSWNAGINLYYMRYRDQLVQTGELSDIGEALTTNIPDSYRAGVELTADYSPVSWLTLEGNAALSRNRLLDFDEYVEDWDAAEGMRRIHYSDKCLSYSPSAILNGFATVRDGGFRVVWHTGYVSRMYLDNTQNEERSLPAYSLSDVQFGYTFKFPRIVKELDLGMDVANIFNAHVAQSGWVYSAICESYGHSDANRYYQIGFIPAAPVALIGHITLRF